MLNPIRKLATGKGSKFQIFQLKICKLDPFKCGENLINQIERMEKSLYSFKQEKVKCLANFNKGLKAYYN